MHKRHFGIVLGFDLNGLPDLAGPGEVIHIQDLWPTEPVGNGVIERGCLRSLCQLHVQWLVLGNLGISDCFFKSFLVGQLAPIIFTFTRVCRKQAYNCSAASALSNDTSSAKEDTHAMMTNSWIRRQRKLSGQGAEEHLDEGRELHPCALSRRVG